MNDRPTADELLDAVRDYLRTEVAPAAPDHRARFRALIAANVIAVVCRELAAGDDGRAEAADIAALLGDPAIADAGVEEANRRLAGPIRSGGADEGEHARAVRAFVRGQVEGKLAVNNPAFLQRFAESNG